MGTFSNARIEYEDPPVPPDFDKGNTRKAFLRGFTCGVWWDRPPYRRYRRESAQKAFEAGYVEAQRQRRKRGERF